MRRQHGQRRRCGRRGRSRRRNTAGGRQRIAAPLAGTRFGEVVFAAVLGGGPVERAGKIPRAGGARGGIRGRGGVLRALWRRSLLGYYDYGRADSKNGGVHGP